MKILKLLLILLVPMLFTISCKSQISKTILNKNIPVKIDSTTLFNVDTIAVYVNYNLASEYKDGYSIFLTPNRNTIEFISKNGNGITSTVKLLSELTVEKSKLNDGYDYTIYCYKAIADDSTKLIISFAVNSENKIFEIGSSYMDEGKYITIVFEVLDNKSLTYNTL